MPLKTKVFFILVAVCAALMFSRLAHSAECEPNYYESTGVTLHEDCSVTLPAPAYELMRDAARAWHQTSTTAPTVDLPPMRLIIDKDGRMFTDGAVGRGTVRWGPHLEAEIEVQNDFTVHRDDRPVKKDPKVRFKAFAWAYPSGLDAGLGIEPWRLGVANVNAVFGMRTLGLAAGVDITRNFGLAAGALSPYADLESTQAMGGLFMSFN